MSSIQSRKHPVGRSLGALALLTLAAPVAAIAQSAPESPIEDTVQGHSKAAGPQERRREGPDKVEITGNAPYQAKSLDRKATASVVDTPQTVQIINEELIRDQGATTLTEALRNSPGVGTFYLGENGTTSTGDAVFLRGSDASGSIFVDGVRDVASVSRDTFNIQQIEVLKGSAGSDIGRGAATGAINLITKRPTMVDSRSGVLGIGEGDHLRGTADLNWRIGRSSGLRMNFLTQDAGVAGRDEVKAKRWGIAPTLGFGIGGDTQLFVSYMHIDQDNIPDGGVLTIGLPGYTTPSPGTGDFLNSAPRVSSTTFYGTKDDHDKIETDTVGVILEHAFSDEVSISNVTRWGETDQEYQLSSFTASAANLVMPNPTDPDTWTMVRNINNKNATNISLTNQTNLQAKFSTGFLAHSISTGVEFIREEQKTRAYAVTGAYPPVSIYNPNPNVAGYSRVLSGAFTKGRTDTLGLYANDTIEITPQFLATAGLRLDHYKTDFDSVAVTGVVTPLRARDDLVSGKFGLAYKPTGDGSLYASYAVTRLPPGGANFSLSAATAANVNNPGVDPQEAKTSEAGVKWNFFGGKLLATGALYRTQYSDTVVQDTDGMFYRTGEKSVEGVELGLVGQITPAWTISAGYTTMKTDVKGVAPVAADGSTDLNYTPSDSLILWSTYVFGNGLTVGGGASYVGELKRGTDGAVGTPKFAESHVVIDALMKYPLTKTMGLQLNVYNLLDEGYVASINKSGYRYNPGVARSVRLTLNVGF
jgi:catecholate siderophore receptor